MGTINIRGGSVGNMVEVDAGNAMRTRRQDEWDVAVAAGLAFSWSSASHNYDAHDTIIAVENNSNLYDLKIKKIVAIAGNAATEVVVFGASGVALTGDDDITGVNLNGTSGLLDTLLATAKGDDTVNTEQASAYPTKFITGRTAATVGITFDVDGAIVLAADQMVGVNFTTVCDDSYATIWGYFVPRQ